MNIKWENVPKSIDNYLGFVYIIINTTNHKFYIGQKKFWFKRTLPALKGKKRKRRSLVESDWKTYNSSSKALQEDIAKLGEDKFVFEILRLCKNKAEMNYLELLYQVQMGVLLRDNSYNGIIQVRINKRGLEGLNANTSV